jgi:hypothetical protein
VLYTIVRIPQILLRAKLFGNLSIDFRAHCNSRELLSIITSYCISYSRKVHHWKWFHAVSGFTKTSVLFCDAPVAPLLRANHKRNPHFGSPINCLRSQTKPTLWVTHKLSQRRQMADQSHSKYNPTIRLNYVWEEGRKMGRGGEIAATWNRFPCMHKQAGRNTKRSLTRS